MEYLERGELAQEADEPEVVPDRALQFRLTDRVVLWVDTDTQFADIAGQVVRCEQSRVEELLEAAASVARLQAESVELVRAGRWQPCPRHQTTGAKSSLVVP